MIEQVGNALLCIGRFTKSKRGQTGLTVTADWDKWVGTTRTALVSGAACTEGRNGDYASALALGSVDEEALYTCNMYTTDATVDLQDIGPMGWAVGKAGVERLDAAVTTRSSHSAADVWAVSTRTLSNFGSLVADVAAAAATAVWAAGTRTLTSFGTLVADLVAALLDTATTAAHNIAGSIGRAIGDAGSATDPLTNEGGDYAAGTIGHEIDETYRKVLTPGSVSVVSGYFGGIVSIVGGDDYAAAHDNVIPIPVANAPDLTEATLSFEVDGVVLNPTVVPTISGTGAARVASVTLTDAHTEQLRTRVPTAGIPSALRVYGRVRATWPDGLRQTIGAVELRKPVWAA